MLQMLYPAQQGGLQTQQSSENKTPLYTLWSVSNQILKNLLSSQVFLLPFLHCYGPLSLKQSSNLKEQLLCVISLFAQLPG